MKENQHFCEDGTQAVPTFVLEIIDISRKGVETKHNNVKLMDHNSDLVMELIKSRELQRLACDRAQNAEARVKAFQKHVEASNSKYSKTVADAAQTEKELRIRVTSLGSTHEVEAGRIASFEEARVDEKKIGAL